MDYSEGERYHFLNVLIRLYPSLKGYQANAKTLSKCEAAFSETGVEGSWLPKESLPKSRFPGPVMTSSQPDVVYSIDCSI